MSNVHYNGGRSGRTQTKATSKSTAKGTKVDKLTKGDTYDVPKGKR